MHRVADVAAHVCAGSEVSVDVTEQTVTTMADAHLIQPYDKLDRPNTTMIQSGGRGIYLITDEGEEIIDGPGGMWNVNVGYGEARLAEAIGAQAMKMAYNSPWHNTSGPAAQLAHKLASLAPSGLNRVFFTTGGSTATDAALQFVAYRNNFLGRPQKKLILARENAYHGSSYLSHSVSGAYDHMDQATEMVAQLLCPDPNDSPDGATLQEWEDILVANLEAVIAEKGADKIGAMIAEPIMGAGGVIVPPPGYLQRCQRVCTANDIVFIADEVVTAFGRLGHYFASEAVFGVEPDIICFAKGVTSGYQPLGGLLIADRMLAALDTEGSKFTTGFTYSGHPVACAAALANLQIFEDDQLIEQVRRTGPYFQSRLREELEPLPLVHTVRGMGLMCGIVLNFDEDKVEEQAKLLDVDCANRGLLVRMLGSGTMVLSPALVITEEEVDKLVGILKDSFVRVTAELGLTFDSVAKNPAKLI